MPEYTGEVIPTAKEYTGQVIPLSGESPVDQIPGAEEGWKRVVPNQPEKPAAPSDPTFLGGVRNAMDTAIEPVISAGTGMAANAVAPYVAMAKGVGKGQTFQQMDKAREDIANSMTYQPRNPNAREALETVGKMVDKSKLAGLNPATAMELASVAGPASKAVGPTAVKAGKAIAESPEVDLLKQGVSKAGKAITPKIDPEVARLAGIADKMGVKVNLDMLTDNNPLKVFGKTMREIPLSGSTTEANRTAFNKAIIKTIDGDARGGKITPAVFDEAMNRHGKKIGEISSKYPISEDGKLRDVVNFQIKAIEKETPDVARVITGYIHDIESKISNGKIDGETFRKLRTELGAQMRSTTNGDLKRALSSLDEGMLDAIQENLKPDELKAFTDARHYYFNGKLIEPLVAKAATKGRGDMSPAAYSNAISSGKSRKAAIARGMGGDPVDISAIGSRFLQEPGTSNTAEKGLAYGALSGSGYLSPPTAAGIYSGANLYNRFGPWLAQKIAKNQK